MVVGEHHVGRFDVAMDDALLVGGAEGAQEGPGEPGGLGDGQPARSGQAVLEGAAGHELHDDPRRPVDDDHVVDADDVRVIAQLGGVAGLASRAVQAVEALGLGQVGLQQELLDRDLGLEGLVPGGPHAPEPTGAEDPFEPVPAAHEHSWRALLHDAPLVALS